MKKSEKIPAKQKDEKSTKSKVRKPVTAPTSEKKSASPNPKDSPEKTEKRRIETESRAARQNSLL